MTSHHACAKCGTVYLERQLCDWCPDTLTTPVAAPPAIPAECWAAPRADVDYLGAARVLSGGSSFHHTEKAA